MRTDATKPHKGQSAGGTVNLDEMSMYAITVSGLSHTMDKLRAQSDIMVTTCVMHATSLQ